MLLWLMAPAEPLVPQQRSAADYELAWAAPAGCPDVAEIRAQIQAMATEQAGAAGTLRVQATVEAEDDGFVLVLETEYAGQLDARTLRASSCNELAESAALVVALSLDPHARAGEGRPPATAKDHVGAEPPEPPRETPTTPEVRATASAPRTPTEALADPKRQWRPRAWGARLAPFAEFGLLPRWSGGASAAGLALWDRWSLELRGSFEVGRATERRDGAGGRVRLGAGAVRACGRLQTKSSVEFPVCGVFEAGRTRAVSEGLVPAASVAFAHLAPGAGAGLAVRGRRVGLVVGAEVLFPLQRAAVKVGESRVFTARPASIRGIVGLEIFFATDPT